MKGRTIFEHYEETKKPRGEDNYCSCKYDDKEALYILINIDSRRYTHRGKRARVSMSVRDIFTEIDM